MNGTDFRRELNLPLLLLPLAFGLAFYLMSIAIACIKQMPLTSRAFQKNALIREPAELVSAVKSKHHDE